MQKELGKFKGTGMSPAAIQNARPEDLGNSQEMELDWAMKAFKYAEVYFKLMSSQADQSTLRLTKMDADIYAHFRREFPDLPVAIVTDDLLKTPAAKLKWRTFCESYKAEPIKVCFIFYFPFLFSFATFFLFLGVVITCGACTP